ncbi:hypothetical protein N7532_007940 [Penicillium argentinense]|uniref:Uncharacterized protein n=1 Tax=Penicillium argentinense TaxID=1131581 RepID=A0A9W9EWN0_9EURO|nr:uncharacterized protein N7532_007940 [Penicillium argentinense]KAJ5089256.1 hypothetical protein N7532_007940 [Penicillium argentinense]
MTFLLNTNPETRSVKLLGSWDNFTRQYVMERDKRVGPGHWKGCHTFTDIMGDGPGGSSGNKSQWRTGGLKMGVTYWYYYLLDDDIESINENEPVTTKCPLLPGQPVNVLNVPIVLPDSRSHGRSGSGSSQKADYRTMNPEDKFMNPRKPPQPTQNSTRVQTATVLRNQPPAVHSNSTSPNPSMVQRSASQPGSAGRYHSKVARSASPPRSRGLLAAFRPANEFDGHRQPSPLPRSKTVNDVLRQDGSLGERRKVPDISANTGAVPVSTTVSQPSTIQSRRAQKAKGGDAVPARNLLKVDTRPQQRKPSLPRGAAAGNNLGTVDETRALKDALEFVASNSSDQTTPTGKDVNEKRLPTLPNTPSSVMDEAVREIDDHDRVMDAEVQRSHFSSLTTTTGADSLHSRFMPERSRFSEWSTDTETENEDNSPESMISTSTFNNHEINESPAVDDWKTPELSQPNDAMTNTDPNTPHLTVHSKPSSPNSASGEIPPWKASLPEFAVSLASPGLQGSGLGIDQMDEVESNPKRHAALFGALESLEALSLSRRSPDGSPIILPERESQKHREALERVRSRSRDGSSQGKKTMQELMDELSYLKNMIQSDMDGEPF